MSTKNDYTVIDHNKMDRIQFNHVLSNSSILKDSLRQGNFVFDEFENLMFDVFLLLYKPVLFISHSTANAEEMLQYSIIQAYLHSTAINKVRLKTAGSRSNTYMSLKWLLDKIFERTRGTSWFADALKEAEATDFENLLNSEQNAELENLNSCENNISSDNNLDDILDKIKQNLDKNLFSDKIYEFIENIEKNRISMQQNNTNELSISQKNESALDMLSKALSKKTKIESPIEESSSLSDSIEKALENLENQLEQDNTEETSALEQLFNEIDKQQMQKQCSKKDDDENTKPKNSENLLSSQENPPNENEDLSIDSEENSPESSHENPDQLIEGKLDSQGSENSSVPPSDSNDSNKTSKNKDNDKDDSNRKSTFKKELLNELDQTLENIIKSDNKDNTSTSYGASELTDSNEQIDSSHIQSERYQGNNEAVSMEFRATKKKWTPSQSPRKSKYQDIIPENLKKRLDNFNLNYDLNNIESSIINFEESINTLGIHKPSVDKLSLDDLLKLHKRFHAPLFLDFINKVGRQKVCARRVLGKKKLKKRFHPRDTLTRSQDLDLLVDDEFINLSLDVEAFENDFYDRYLHNNLLTVEMTKEVGQYKGPIILCYDGSGSMEGTKLEETQSHILSIIEIARIQKRSLILIQFASASEPLFIKKINPNKIDVQDVLDILDTFLCGGTDFEKPLSVAIEYIKADKRNHSDILFITDGECEISQTFLDTFKQVKEKRKFQLYTIIIHSYTYKDYGNIGEISDEVLEIGENNWKSDVDQHLFSML